MNCLKEQCNTSVPGTKLLPKLLPILISDYALTKNKSYVLTAHLSSGNFSCGLCRKFVFEDALEICGMALRATQKLMFTLF